jgi:hypothetical protein
MHQELGRLPLDFYELLLKEKVVTVIQVTQEPPVMEELVVQEALEELEILEDQELAAAAVEEEE